MLCTAPASNREEPRFTELCLTYEFAQTGNRKETGVAISAEEYRERASYCLRAARGSADMTTWLLVAEGFVLLAASAEAAEADLETEQAEAPPPRALQQSAKWPASKMAVAGLDLRHYSKTRLTKIGRISLKV